MRGWNCKLRGGRLTAGHVRTAVSRSNERSDIIQVCPVSEAGDWAAYQPSGCGSALKREAPRPLSVLGAEPKRALADVIEQGPIPVSHGVVHWRIVGLMQWLLDE